MDNNVSGIFSDRLEALIAAALQDGVLTDKERELLKRRAEKEGEDWDEVEMIIEARLAEMQTEKEIVSAATPQIDAIELKDANELNNEGLRYYNSQNYEEAVKRCFKAADVHEKTNIFEGDYYKKEKNIVIPEGVTVIAAYTCKDFEELENLTLPSTLVTIEKFAFYNCPKLKTVDFTRCKHLKEIGENAFAYCEKLEELDIPNSVKSIGMHTFYHCDSLKQVFLPASLEEAEKNIFGFCKKLEEIDFSKCTQFKRLSWDLMCTCENLKKIILPVSLEEIGNGTFSSCEELEEVDFSLSTQLKRIGDNTFAYCKKLQKIILPVSLEEIGNGTFSRCEKLEEIDFSLCTQLKRIGDETFDRCKKLLNIVLPDSVTFIGQRAFANCEALRLVVLPASLEKLEDEVFRFCELDNLDMSKVTHLSTIPKGFGCTKTMMIPQGVTTIAESGFKNYSRVSYRFHEKLFLPSTLESYGKGNGRWNAIYLYAPQFEDLETLLEGNNILYVLPQYLNVYKELWEALGKPNKQAEILPMPDEYLYYYDN